MEEGVHVTSDGGGGGSEGGAQRRREGGRTGGRLPVMGVRGCLRGEKNDTQVTTRFKTTPRQEVKVKSVSGQVKSCTWTGKVMYPNG